MPSQIIARADALMHRRRQSDQDFDDIPVLTDSIDDFDDIPVLTEVESALENALSQLEDSMVTVEATEAVEAVESVEAEEPLETVLQALPTTPAIDPAIRDQLVHELTCRIEERIKAALPEIISSTVRDFLADQDMIANS